MAIFYHGTDSVSAQKILQKGFNARGCLTTDIDLAWHFAECRIEELKENDELLEDTDEIVIKVEVENIDLVVDYPAYEEPITIYRNNFCNNESDWHQGIEDGDIPYPLNETDVETALSVTTCVRAKVLIAGERFSIA